MTTLLFLALFVVAILAFVFWLKNHNLAKELSWMTNDRNSFLNEKVILNQENSELTNKITTQREFCKYFVAQENIHAKLHVLGMEFVRLKNTMLSQNGGESFKDFALRVKKHEAAMNEAENHLMMAYSVAKDLGYLVAKSPLWYCQNFESAEATSVS